MTKKSISIKEALTGEQHQKSYSEKLKHPKWQRKRLEIMQRDDFKCRMCGDTETTLNVHHLEYSKGSPWDIENEKLITLCEQCHLEIEEMQVILNDKIDFSELNIRKRKSDKENASATYIIRNKGNVYFIDRNKIHTTKFIFSFDFIDELNEFARQAKKYEENNPLDF